MKAYHKEYGSKGDQENGGKTRSKNICKNWDWKMRMLDTERDGRELLVRLSSSNEFIYYK